MREDRILISFIIPAYNAGKTIGRAISSILSQSKDKTSIEIIVIENGSTDDTSNVVEKLVSENGPFLQLLHSEKGVSNARNKGIQYASGEWIAFVDADDYLVEGAMDILLRDAANMDYDLITYSREVGTQKIYVTKQERLICSGKKLEQGRAEMIANPTLYMQVWGKLFKRQIIETYKIGFDPTLRLAEDSDFTMRYSCYVGSLCFRSAFVYHYSIDEPSTMRGSGGAKTKAYIYAMDRTYRVIADESETIKSAYNKYVLMHLNILMVRDVFVAGNKERFLKKIHRMENIIKTKRFAQAIRDTKITECRNIRMFPIFMMKLRLNIFSGIIYHTRAFLNAHREDRERIIGKRENRMYKVLVFGMTENPGGVESFLLNYYRHIDRDKMQFDFLCNSYEKVAYEDELTAMGGKTYHFPARSKNPVQFHKKLKRFFKERAKEYDAIWVNVCSLANIDYLKMAKKYGISKRIIHSHNSQNMDSKLRGTLHRINKRSIDKYATDFWACSPDAAKWFYSDELLKKAVVIHNAIDVDKMAYNLEKRKEFREKLGCQDQFIIGNVGRLHFQKNQSFLLDIFQKVLESESGAELVLIGQGEDERMLREKAQTLGIAEKVHFMGVQYDVPGWLSAFDLFLFPSVFEGLSVVALEAQANGVPVLASSGVIPEEVRMNDNFMFFSLDQSAEAWAGKALEMKNCGRVDAETIKNTFIQNGYDINTEAEKLERGIRK